MLVTKPPNVIVIGVTPSQGTNQPYRTYNNQKKNKGGIAKEAKDYQLVVGFSPFHWQHKKCIQGESCGRGGGSYKLPVCFCLRL